MKRWFIPVLFFLEFTSFAQKQENVWAFGEAAGVDFNANTPFGFRTSIDGKEGSASVCNEAGQLLFYTEGSLVWNRNHDLMPNGHHLTDLPALQNGNDTLTATISTTQGTIIVPVIDTPGKYYIFSLSSWEYGSDAGRLYYSVVDMSLEGGLGDVEQSRKGIFLDSGFQEKIVAIVGDRCNIWLVLTCADGVSFKSFEITQTGIDPNPVISTPGSFSTAGIWPIGVIKASPDRKKVAICNEISGLGICDFDPVTGVVSNAVQLSQQPHYGASFSPNGMLLYVVQDDPGAYNIYQFDLSLPTPNDIKNSKMSIGPSNVGDIKIGPDGKLYFGSINHSLGAIELPNVVGTGCQYSQSVVALNGGKVSFGLPNVVPIFVRDTATSSSHNILVCFADSITLSADTTQDKFDLWWEGGATTESITVDSSGTYVVHYHTAPCVYHTDTFNVLFLSPAPEGGAFAGCKGESNSYLWVQPGAGDNNNYNYTWIDSSGNVISTAVSATGDTVYTNNQGKYFVTISGDDCDTTIVVELNLPDYAALFVVDDSVICIGDATFLQNSSFGFSDYLWSFGDGDTSTETNPVHLYQSPGTYQIYLVGNPCADSATATVTVDSMSYVRFDVGNQPLCEGQGITFYSSYPDGADTLTWNFGDGTFLTEGFQPVHAYDTSGIWTVTLTASFRACPDASFVDSVTTFSHPTVNVGPDTSICPGGEVIRLSGRVEPSGTVQSYLWNTGDETESINARHHGIYWVQAVNEWGCKGTDSVEVFKSCYLHIPNAFTPNGDGVNDYFLPRQDLSRRLTRFTMEVYNRWGQVIFRTDRLDGRGWDGRFNGSDQPGGVYIYLIVAEIDGRNNESYKGNLTLIR